MLSQLSNITPGNLNCFGLAPSFFTFLLPILNISIADCDIGIDGRFLERLIVADLQGGVVHFLVTSDSQPEIPGVDI